MLNLFAAVTAKAEDMVLNDGTSVRAHCSPKPGLADSYLAAQSVHCDKHLYDKEKCTAFQQYCDWTYDLSNLDTAEYKNIPEDRLFNSEDLVLDALYSATHGLYPPKKIESMYYGTDLVGEVRQPRKSKWAFWHHDVMTVPEFVHLGCDCLELTDAHSELVEKPDGYYLTNGCHDICGAAFSGSEEMLDNKLYSIYTVHDRVCHREVDIDGVRWDPSPNMNYITPLSKLFPTRLGPEGLDMKRGEGGASWYWWGHSKPSWNANDQTSNVHVGELQFDTEAECKAYATTYWDLENYDTNFLSVCSRFSSKTPCSAGDHVTPLVTNDDCAGMCGDKQFDFTKYSLDSSNLDEVVNFFHENCVYTPYQPENDHSWPNFYVPDSNPCFSQWQIGYEDQACDQCIHPEYDNTLDFNDGWSYGPVETSDIAKDPLGKGNCAAQCGKIIMDGPGRPRDVKTAQECQQKCQEDSNCVAFQWRPTPDWDLAATDVLMGDGNRINQVRSCLLKNQAQVDGALAARWDETGNWLYHPEEDYASYANIYQNNDCAQSNSGEGYNWCLACKETIDVEGAEPEDQVLYHAFKWRNNMISGPKFCDVPKLTHGSDDRPESKFWDSENNPQVVPDCPNYPGIGSLIGKKPYTERFNNDDTGVAADQGCFAKDGLVEELEGGVEWAEHCVSANRRESEDACDRFQQYCDWIIEYRLTSNEYKAFSDEQLFGVPKTIDPSTYSANFGIYVPTEQGGVYKNDLPQRTEKWVFWHYDKLSVQYPLSCDCLEEGCNDPSCDLIADSADVYGVYTLADKVCHLESNVNGVRFDPSPNPNLGNLWEAEWQTGLGMASGEAGSSWFWYGHSKPSWNEFDQTSHVKVGEVMFDTEADCREYATAYWKDLGFDLFLSVCEMYSSKTIGISNDTCRAVCDSTSVEGKDITWFKENCAYTPYQGESDHAWPNVYVPEANTCFAQWQIGYEDQACDHCIHDMYDNIADFNGGWSYHPVVGSYTPAEYTCDAQCGKFVMDGPGVPRDVKTAQECQTYCQEDSNCVAFQWRWTPDYTAAPSLFGVPDGTIELNNNRYNKVRLCALKSADQLIGALDARWDASGQWVDDSNPSWVEGESADVPYNQYAQGEWAINDSQNSNRSGEGNNWYLECKLSGDSASTTHSWKWRNNMVSGPKYCDSDHTMRVSHGAYRPGSRTYDAPSSFTVPDCPTLNQIRYSENEVATRSTSTRSDFPDYTDSPEYIGITTTTTTTTTEEWDLCCDIGSYDECIGAWEGDCNANVFPKCAFTCGERVHDKTCRDLAKQFATLGEQYNVDIHCSNEAEEPPAQPKRTITENTNGWSGITDSCVHTITTTTSTTSAVPEWDFEAATPDHNGIPSDVSIPNVDSSSVGTVYKPLYDVTRDGISALNDTVTVAAVTPNNCVAGGATTLSAANMSRDEYLLARGTQKLMCAGWTEDKHSASIMGHSDCNTNHFDIFSYTHLAQAAGAFPDFMGSDDLATNQLDLASFLAHTSSETRGGTGKGHGYCYYREKNAGSYDTTGSNDCGNTDREPENINGDPHPSHFIGRGAIQTTWCTNYYNARDFFADIGEPAGDIDFDVSPSKITQNWYVWASGLIFYMTPEVHNTKPSMHHIATLWANTEYANLPVDNENRVADFGYQINILNGGLECTNSAHSSLPARLNFLHYFLHDLAYEGVTDFAVIGGGCLGHQPLTASFKYFYDPVTGEFDGADTLITLN